MKASRWKNQWPLHLMIWPAVALLFVYSYVPIAGALFMAFQKFNPAKGVFASPWVGLDNFRYIFSMPDMGRVLFNTVYIASMKIVAGLLVPIAFALMLNEVRVAAVKRTFQTLVYLPHFLSWVILSGILIDILSPSEGIVNKAIAGIGLQPVFFLTDNRWFPFVLVTSDVWKEFGYATIIYLAALTSINPALYEAAEIDGASRWKRTIYVSLPGMAPIIVLMAALSLGNVLNAGFEQIFNLYNALVYESGDVIDTLVYRIGLEQAQYSVATAVGLFKSLVSMFFIVISYGLAYRFANYRLF
ncbi:ABC transporter permease [Cohnella sp. GbtcB17]|uniref:ABC transporter permease n=1 Tax=Cohnella sp. GbtcB17 TaxID=2824762 RepID=UPI0034D52106